MLGKLLATGQVANTEGAIYTVPASTTTYIKSMTFYNTGAIAQTLIVYARDGAGTSRVIGRAVLQENWTCKIDDSLVLEATDTIRAQTTNATTVDYSIYGVEEA